jgi:hypothetical protein
MRWVDALKIYNQGKGGWCIPRKGTKEYDEVRKIMRPTAPADKALRKEKPTSLKEDILAQLRNVASEASNRNAAKAKRLIEALEEKKNKDAKREMEESIAARKALPLGHQISEDALAIVAQARRGAIPDERQAFLLSLGDISYDLYKLITSAISKTTGKDKVIVKVQQLLDKVSKPTPAAKKVYLEFQNWLDTDYQSEDKEHWGEDEWEYVAKFLGKLGNQINISTRVQKNTILSPIIEEHIEPPYGGKIPQTSIGNLDRLFPPKLVSIGEDLEQDEADEETEDVPYTFSMNTRVKVLPKDRDYISYKEAEKIFKGSTAKGSTEKKEKIKAAGIPQGKANAKTYTKAEAIEALQAAGYGTKSVEKLADDKKVQLYLARTKLHLSLL